MQVEHGRTKHKLLCFKVPGLPDWGCALALPEVVEAARIPSVTVLPLEPQYVIGVSQWQSRIVTIVDLAAALSGHRARQPVWSPDSQYLIARMPIGAHLELVAWPIMNGSSVIVAPSSAPWIDTPRDFVPSMIRASIAFDNSPLVMLNLEGLTTLTDVATTFK